MSAEPGVSVAFALLFSPCVKPVNTLHKYAECFLTKYSIVPCPGSRLTGENPRDVVRRFIFDISEWSILGAYTLFVQLFFSLISHLRGKNIETGTLKKIF
jgi:hypothetical protein